MGWVDIGVNLSNKNHTGESAKTVTYAWALMTNHTHILLRSGPEGISTYNLRHRRYGHLFQNRYKSIVCEKDAYFKELVRYIHLNPLGAKMVETPAKLSRYRWCGHGVILGRFKNTILKLI